MIQEQVSTRNVYVGCIGWSSNTQHFVIVEECNCDKFEGTHSHVEAYAACKPYNSHHYRIGPVTRVRHIEPTYENITCKDCRKKQGWDAL